jgi:hypothetical protein
MIQEKLHEIQAKLVVPKSHKNNFGNYKYRNLDGILDALNPLLAQTNCTCRLKDSIEHIGDRYYVKATAILTYKDEKLSCSAYAREAQTKKGMDEAQITGASSSYARKYALAGLFSIGGASDNDYDSLDNSGEGDDAGANASVSGSESVDKPSPSLLDELNINSIKDFKSRAIKGEDKIIESTIESSGETIGLIQKDSKKLKGYIANNSISKSDRKLALGALCLTANDDDLQSFVEAYSTK